MDKSMAEWYRDRWQAVVEVENTEQRQTSFSQRWRKLNSIVRMAAALGLDLEKDSGQDDIIYQRWNDLRKRYLAEVEGKRP
jgi:hypothetical protein